MVIKLDLANAFDKVIHSFLLSVLRRMGFAKDFFKWVKSYISSPWIAPLVNGNSIGFFRASRALRQGCPPLLFYSF